MSTEVLVDGKMYPVIFSDCASTIPDSEFGSRMNRRILGIKNRVDIVRDVSPRIQRIRTPAGVRAVFVEFVLIGARHAASRLPADAKPNRLRPLSEAGVECHLRRRILRNRSAGVRSPVVEFTGEKNRREIARRFVEEFHIDAILGNGCSAGK